MTVLAPALSDHRRVSRWPLCPLCDRKIFGCHVFFDFAMQYSDEKQRPTADGASCHMIVPGAEKVWKRVAGGMFGTFSIYQVRPHRAEPKASAWTIVMSEIDFKPKLKQKTKVQRPKLYKVMLLNDDYTPREFVTLILKAEFRLDESQAEVVMMTAHQKGVCVVSVYPRDVAETKATRAVDAAGRLGYPLQFTVEPE